MMYKSKKIIIIKIKIIPYDWFCGPVSHMRTVLIFVTYCFSAYCIVGKYAISDAAYESPSPN